MIGIYVLVFICLIILSAFFSSAETAIFSIDEITVRALVRNGVKGAKKLEHLRSNPSLLLSTILLGNNLVNIAASTIFAYIAIQAFGSAGISIATGIMTFVILIFGEISPKSIAAAKAKKIALASAPAILFLQKALYPLVKPLSIITKTILEKNKKTDERITEEEIKAALSLGEEQGVVESGEREMIHNIFKFTDLTVDDIMIPRTEVEIINGNKTLQEAWPHLAKTKFSRLPVYLEDKDNIIGVLYIKHILHYVERNEWNKKLKELILPPLFVPETKHLDSLLSEFQKHRLHMAIVVDEYGGFSGIVTLEDLLEEIVGDIEDENYVAEEDIKRIGKKTYIVNAHTDLDIINELLGLNIEDSSVDTIGGFVIHKLDHIPKPKEKITLPNAIITVTKSNDTTVQELRIRKR